MKILIFDQHSDLTKSLLYRLGLLGVECYIADNSILPLAKWSPDILRTNRYVYAFQIGSKPQLTSGFFDAIITNSRQTCLKLKELVPARTKVIYFNGVYTNLNRTGIPLNVLSQDTRSLKTAPGSLHCALFVISLPPVEHQGPNLNGQYIQLIFDFTKRTQSPHSRICRDILDSASSYRGRSLVSYGDPGKSVHDEAVFPDMYCLLHIKNWGAGMDYALAKAMARGIPAILYVPFLKGTVCEQFISEKTSFLFSNPKGLQNILELADHDPQAVIDKGTMSESIVRQFMADDIHQKHLEDFLGSLQ